MVNRLCEPGRRCRRRWTRPPHDRRQRTAGLKQAKKSIRYGAQMEIRTAYRFEVEAYNQLVDTEDRHEGILAFNEKRKPRFKGK